MTATIAKVEMLVRIASPEVLDEHTLRVIIPAGRTLRWCPSKYHVAAIEERPLYSTSAALNGGASPLLVAGEAVLIEPGAAVSFTAGDSPVALLVSLNFELVSPDGGKYVS